MTLFKPFVMQVLLVNYQFFIISILIIDFLHLQAKTIKGLVHVSTIDSITSFLSKIVLPNNAFLADNIAIALLL
jgi:hypothetical protein